jgi:ADP-ribosylglycohydrolase
MLLHALGDTLGFRNTLWEFSDGGYEKVLRKVYEFIDLGGITGINLDGWLVSDDTIMHMQTARALIEYNKDESINTLGNLFSKYFITALKQFEIEGPKRAPGVSTMKALMRLKNGNLWNENPYNLYAGGSGASMRCLCIGMAFPKSCDRHKLIQVSIESSRITNNSVIGYLGGMTSALFAALAVEGINVEKWAHSLLELFDNGTIQKYIKTSGRGYDEYIKDSPIFIEKWHRYVDDKFDGDGNIIKRKSSINLIYRCKYYNETFAFKKKINNTFWTCSWIHKN